jgi:hypothetical protein
MSVTSNGRAYTFARHPHLCGTLAVESRAGQREYTDIERRATHLYGRVEGLLNAPESGHARPQSGRLPIQVRRREP